MKKIDWILEKSISVVAGLGMSVVLLMMFLTSGDSLSRTFFNHSVAGAHELAEFMMVTLAFLAVGYTELKKGHVFIDVFTSKLSEKAQRIFESITSFLSLAIYSLITWQTILYGLEMRKTGVISPILNIRIFPFVFVTGVGTGLLCLVLLRNFLNTLFHWEKE